MDTTAALEHAASSEDEALALPPPVGHPDARRPYISREELSAIWRDLAHARNAATDVAAAPALVGEMRKFDVVLDDALRLMANQVGPPQPSQTFLSLPKPSHVFLTSLPDG